jgi:hypothetical protein
MHTLSTIIAREDESKSDEVVSLILEHHRLVHGGTLESLLEESSSMCDVLILLLNGSSTPCERNELLQRIRKTYSQIPTVLLVDQFQQHIPQISVAHQFEIVLNLSRFQKVLPTVLHKLSAQQEEELRHEPQYIPLGNSPRGQVTMLMQLALHCWENVIGKSKIELCEESGLWTLTLDRSTYRARHLERHLKLSTTPHNPDYLLILKTAQFVAKQCPYTVEYMELETRIRMLEFSLARSQKLAN